MTHYTVASHYRLTELVDLVNAAIAKGYQPLGGVSFVVSPGGSYEYLQALIKEEK